jgi:hypothetical protein
MVLDDAYFCVPSGQKGVILEDFTPPSAT